MEKQWQCTPSAVQQQRDCWIPIALSGRHRTQSVQSCKAEAAWHPLSESIFNDAMTWQRRHRHGVLLPKADRWPFV